MFRCLTCHYKYCLWLGPMSANDVEECNIPITKIMILPFGENINDTDTRNNLQCVLSQTQQKIRIHLDTVVIYFIELPKLKLSFLMQQQYLLHKSVRYQLTPLLYHLSYLQSRIHITHQTIERTPQAKL